MFFETLSLLRAGLLPDSKDDVRALYALLHAGNLPNEKTRFINLGYWEGAEPDFDSGPRALAARMSKAAQLDSARHVVDVGFGYGDQILQWLDTTRAERVVGINIVDAQARYAASQLSRHPRGHNVSLTIGSASDLPLKSKSFDRVIALESAFHFSPRTRFFEEAFRVLEPGGLIATADILMMPGQVIGWPMTTAWRIPKANLVDARAYAAHLRAAGFADVRVESIRDRVFEPLLNQLAERLQRGDVSERMNPLLRAVCRPSALTRRILARLDYVMAVGRKP